jgi:hypothetical protein
LFNYVVVQRKYALKEKVVFPLNCAYVQDQLPIRQLFLIVLKGRLVEEDKLLYVS